MPRVEKELPLTTSQMPVATPRRLARVVLAMSVLAVCFMDFGAYRTLHLAAPNAWMDVVRGTADAPQQYRVGVVDLAWWLTGHTGLGMHYWLALIDGASLLVAVMVLLGVLERTEIYRRASVPMQWFGAAAFVMLVQFDLVWLPAFPRPETLAAAMLVALSLWLWKMDGGPRWLIVTGVLMLAGLQGLVRADVACLLNFGVFLVAISPLGTGLSLPRGIAAGTSFIGALVAGGMQFYLAKVAYPQASYGRVKMWQLLPNLRHATRWPPFLLLMLPVIWMTVQVVRRKFSGDGAGVAMMVGALVYVVLWVTVGKVDEVRIFLPFALALAPLMVEMAMLRVGAETE